MFWAIAGLAFDAGGADGLAAIGTVFKGTLTAVVIVSLILFYVGYFR
jgi:hypothetical protein